MCAQAKAVSSAGVSTHASEPQGLLQRIAVHRRSWTVTDSPAPQHADLDRLLNDPEVPMDAARIWQLLAASRSPPCHTRARKGQRTTCGSPLVGGESSYTVFRLRAGPNMPRSDRRGDLSWT